MVWLLIWLYARAPGPSAVTANLRDLSRRKAAGTIARPKDAKLGALYDTFVAKLTEVRTASGARKINSKMKIGATSAAADASSRSAQAFSSPKAGLLKRTMSAPAGGARARKQTKIGDFGAGAASNGQIVAAQHAVDTDVSRLVYGKDLSFAFAEWPLVEQLARSLLKAGAAGMTLPSPADRANPQFTPRRLTLTLPKRDRLATTQIDTMHAHGMTELKGRVESLVGTFGYSMTCDGTDRYQRAVVNWLICLPDRTNACLDVTVTGKQKKTAVWWAAATVRTIKGPLNPMPAAKCTLGNFDGGMLYAFEAIETAFKHDPQCANLIANWCACHGHHLLIDGIFDLDGFGDTFDEVNKVVKYVRHHTTVRCIMDKYSPGKGFVRHCETRMASKVLVLLRFWELATDCKSTAAVTSPEWVTQEGELKGKDKVSVPTRP